MKSNRYNSNRHLTIVEDFVALFFPKYCLGCTEPLVKGEEILCTSCIIELPQTNYHLGESNPLKERLLGRVNVNNALAFLKFNKKGGVQHLLHQLKYNNHPEIGVVLGKIYGKQLIATGLTHSYDLLLPVPLHASREARRGYNQSMKFAEGLGSSTNIQVDDSLLIRTKKTVTQTKKTRVERWENVKDVFTISDETQIKGRNIILVDDVITTGATLEALGEKIVKAGCEKLMLICLAEAQ